MHFEVKTQEEAELKPGLYIPSKSFVRGMRIAETWSNIDYSVAEIEDEYAFAEALEKKIEKQYPMGQALPNFLRQKFEGYILENPYVQDRSKTRAFEAKEFDIQVVRRINKYLGRMG